MTLRNWQNTTLQIDFPLDAVQLDWIIDDARPGLLPGRSVSVLSEYFGKNLGRGIKKIDIEIVTQQPGQEAGGVCSAMSALPSSIKRMCAQFRVYGEDLEKPGIYAVLEYGHRQSSAEVDSNYQQLKKRTEEIVKSHGAQLYWPPPTDKQMREMAGRMTPLTFDAEFRLNPKIEITWSDLGIDKLN
jgi:hypothetical protein